MNLLVSIERDESGMWVVECPAIPGSVRQGKTRSEALRNVGDAIGECLIAREQQGIPPPSGQQADSSTAEDPTLAEKFSHLVREWKTTRSISSNPEKLAMHPSYQKIIGLGPKAIPLILGELDDSPSLWFWALRSLTDANPVLPEHRGNFRKKADDWLDWARHHGYAWN